MRDMCLSGRNFARSSARVLAFAILVLVAREGKAQPCPGPKVEYANQGWSAADRKAFYATGQGSHLMPYAFFKALRRLDVDEPFAADRLKRYGYFCNETADLGDDLPIGFVVDPKANPPSIGLTCAACHTGQVEYRKHGATHVMRIDGAPAKTDIQGFVYDLVDASRKSLMQPARFAAFASAAIAAGYPAADAAAVRADFQAWVDKFGDLIDHGLPALSSPSWGPGRLDAFGMIFNRVTAFDLALPGNYRHADAPVRYPFLWNAPRQDHTEWNGQTPNGSDLFALLRNTGEVLGVFADFAPKLAGAGIDFSANSVDFAGLGALEQEIKKLKPPPWPFAINKRLAREGKPLYDKVCGQNCHEKKPSPDPLTPGAWWTPTIAAGTDPNMVSNTKRDAPDPGLFLGQPLPPPDSSQTFGNPAKARDIVAASVLGVILKGVASHVVASSILQTSGVKLARRKQGAPSLRLSGLPDDQSLFLSKDIERLIMAKPSPTVGAAYEARVLCGIWAAAPYLHNGSVANLHELLQPEASRALSFMVGSRVYDHKSVGYVIDESPFDNGTFTADPQNSNGNGNLGHNYGTDLSGHQKNAIIEYLKTLDSRSPGCL